jgi:hypothetical protein
VCLDSIPLAGVIWGNALMQPIKAETPPEDERCKCWKTLRVAIQLKKWSFAMHTVDFLKEDPDQNNCKLLSGRLLHRYITGGIEFRVPMWTTVAPKTQ